MTTAGPAHRVQSAVVEYGFPAGHLGHLSAEEEATFANFKLACQEKGYYKPSVGSEPATHDDATLLRFLRARRFVVNDALKQFIDTENWRKANELNKLYETIDLEHYEETRRLYPQWTGRRDRRGIPVYIYEVRHLTSKRMSAYEKSAAQTKSKAKTDGKTPPKLLRLFALYENLTRFIMPLCTALTDREYPNTPITQSNNIVDISSVGLKQFWNLRTHMQDASTLATAHYPETLDRIFIIGAPAFFPTVWGWIKKWFDPITTSKIFILSSHDMRRTLESFIHPANIPEKYGGTLPFKFGDMPVLDPALKDIISWEGSNTNFPSGPMYWETRRDAEGESIEAVAVGSTEQKQRMERICRVKKLDAAATLDANHKTVVVNGDPLDNPKTTEQLKAEGSFTDLRPDLMRAPTAEEFAERQQAEGGGSALQDGESPPDDSPSSSVSHTPPNGPRPGLESFVTATEGLSLDKNEKKENGVAAVAPPAGGADSGKENSSIEKIKEETKGLMEKVKVETDKVMEKV